MGAGKFDDDDKVFVHRLFSRYMCYAVPCCTLNLLMVIYLASVLAVMPANDPGWDEPRCILSTSYLIADRDYFVAPTTCTLVDVRTDVTLTEAGDDEQKQGNLYEVRRSCDPYEKGWPKCQDQCFNTHFVIDQADDENVFLKELSIGDTFDCCPEEEDQDCRPAANDLSGITETPEDGDTWDQPDESKPGPIIGWLVTTILLFVAWLAFLPFYVKWSKTLPAQENRGISMGAAQTASSARLFI